MNVDRIWALAIRVAAAALIAATATAVVADRSGASTEPPGSATTVVDATTTAVEDSTISAPTTAAPSSPSTTVDPVAALDAAISEAAVHATEAARDALLNVDDPASSAALDRWYVAGSPARARVDRMVQERRDSARRLRPHPSVSDAVTVERVVPGAGASPTRAGVVVCRVEASEEVSQTSQVLGQEVTSYREVYEMNLVGEQWRLLTSSNLQTWTSTAECAPPTDQITLAADVTIRISEINAVQLSVVMNPDAPNADELLRSVATDNGDVYAGTLGFIDSLRAQGQALRIEPGRPRATTIERLDPLDGPPVTRLDALVCGVDASVIFEPGAGPDGQDVIVNDLISAERLVFHLVIENGSWQLDRAEAIDRWTGTVECPAS